MFGMAGETEFDVRFRIFGIPVRIHPIFWLSSAFLVWNGDRMDLVFIGILCVLVSILVHELGHAVMSRRYGYPSEIVLYFFGGYATTAHFPTWRRIVVTAAGPGIGLILFGIVYLVWTTLIKQAPHLLLQYDAIFFALRIMLFANLVWNVMNLIPCLPLDGGQIMQALVYRYGGRQASDLTMKISIAASGAVAVWAIYCLQQQQQGQWVNLIPIPQWAIPSVPVEMLQPSPGFLAFFFGYLCAQNLIAYNETKRFL